MFDRLFKIWGGKNLLGQAFDEFNAILDEAKRLFDAATDVLLAKEGARLTKEELCRRDTRINDLERSIRSKIIEYLAFEPDGDAPAALVLFSVVKDAERLGDFCKDIMDLVDHMKMGGDHEKYRKPLLEMESQLEKMFDNAQRAFLESDEKLARSVVETKALIKKECKEVLSEVMKDNELNSEGAASLALVIYYFKRVSAHLFNIGSTVLVPAAQIGHYKLK